MDERREEQEELARDDRDYDDARREDGAERHPGPEPRSGDHTSFQGWGG